jgi:aquaporin Z
MTADTSATGADTDITTADAEPTLRQKLAAEAIGTFILVLFGCGAVVFSGIFAAQQENPRDLAFITTVGLSFGLAVVVGVYAFGRISGGHFNPAVSVGAAISGRLSWVTAGYYAVAQIIGAIVAALALWVFAHGYDGYSSVHNGLGQDSFGGPGGFGWWAAFLLELVMTAVFVYVILGTTDERNPYAGFAPLAIGLTLTGIHFVAIPADGTSVNPARSIGPALFAGSHAIGQLWLFILAPLIGGAIAGITYPLVFGRVSDPVPGSGLVLPAKTNVGTTPEYAGWGQQGWGGNHPGETGTQQAVAQQTVPQQVPADLPVIEQDGWRWDYAAQQWRPIEQPAAPADEPEGKTVIKQDPPQA